MAKKMKNDNPQGSNELRGTLCRVVRLLEFLKKNTDKDKVISQTKLYEAGGEDHIFGARATIKKYIAALAEALNTDEYGILKPKEDWRLSYKAFDERDGENDEADGISKHVTGIYYNRFFSDDELTKIINALCTSKAVSKADAQTIAGKLVKNIAKKDYKPPAYKLDFTEQTDILPGTDRSLLPENIAELQRAISKGYRIAFRYNRIYSKLLNPKEKWLYGKTISSVSPFYIVCENGKVFLYCGLKDGTFSVFRVDMMSEIRPSGKGEISSLKKNEVIGLPKEITEKFKPRHLYSSYKDDWTKIKFKWSCHDEDTKEFICTALYGAFGNEFEIDEDGTVTVTASRFGMKIFALQYADYVKVIEPADLVNNIAESVRGLRDKYL